MWTCSKCGTKVDPGFDVCWACGTSVDGVEDPTFVAADADVPGEAIESPMDLNMPEGDELIPATDPIEGELVEAYSALDLMEAKFLADKLSEAGFPAVSDTHDMHDALGSMTSTPRVWVRAIDFAGARVWLEEYERRRQAEHGATGMA